MGKNELEVDSLSKSFGDFQILSDVYLKCETGQVIGVLGRNGCGKSTLLKIIFGILHTFNKNIRINGKVHSNPYKGGKQMAYLPQCSFLPEGCSLRRIVSMYHSKPEVRERVLEDSRVKPHLEKRIYELSGGERRYFEILLLVNLEVKFVLLDEPFSGIEPLYKERIKELISRHRKTKGFIVTDHDYRNIIEASDKIVLISDGVCRHLKSNKELELWHYVPAGTFEREEEVEKIRKRF